MIFFEGTVVHPNEAVAHLASTSSYSWFKTSCGYGQGQLLQFILFKGTLIASVFATCIKKMNLDLYSIFCIGTKTGKIASSHFYLTLKIKHLCFTCKQKISYVFLSITLGINATNYR